MNYNHCPDCGAKNEGNSAFCPLCGFALNPNSALIAKDQKIQELEEKVAQLEQRIMQQPRRSSSLPMNFPFWIIPLTVIAFFGMFALIIFIMVSR